MARIRTIKPEFWTDEKVVELSIFARLLFIGIWNFCDDDGRMVYSPKRLKMQIFPSDNVDCSKLIGEIRNNSLINIYVVDNIEYLQVLGFTKHQKVDKRTPSKLPPPPNPSESPRIVQTEGKGKEGIKERIGKEKPKEDIGDKSPPPSVLMMLWNQIIKTPQVTALSKTRESKCRLRLTERSGEEWANIMAIISNTPFLRGENDRGWRADFDWLISNDTNAVKVLEGKYENSGRQTQFKTIGQRITENNLQAARDFIGEDLSNGGLGQNSICFDDERDRGCFPVRCEQGDNGDIFQLPQKQ